MKLFTALAFTCLLGSIGHLNAQPDSTGVMRFLTMAEMSPEDLDSLAAKCQSLYFQYPALAMELSVRGLEESLILGDSAQIAKFLNIQAGIYRMTGLYHRAARMALRVNQVYKSNGDSLRYALSFINLVAVYWDYYDDTGFHEYGVNPLEEVLKNLSVVEKNAPHNTISSYYQNIAGLYISENNFEKAGLYGRKALKEGRLSGDPVYIADAWAILGLAVGNEFKRDSIEIYIIDSSEHYCEKSGYVLGRITNQNNIADFYYTINELDLAEKHWMVALRLLENNAHFEDWLNEVYMNLAKLYDAKEDYARAFHYQTKYLELEREKYQVQSNQLIAVTEAERRKLTRQAELAQSEAAKKRTELENTQLEKYISYGLLSFVIILGMVLVLSNYSKIRNYKYLRLKSTVNDHYVTATHLHNHQIAKELDDIRHMIIDRMEKRNSKAPVFAVIAKRFKQIEDYTNDYTFISYSTRDSQTVIDRCQKRLDKEDFRMKIDVKDFAPGKALVEEVNKHVEGASHVLVMLSQNSFASSWVATEVFRLSSGTKRQVIVCDLDGAIHREGIEKELKSTAMAKLEAIENEIQQSMAKGESLGLLSSERDKWKEYMAQLPSNIVNLRENLMINLTTGKFEKGMEQLVKELHKSQAPKNQ